MTAQPLSPVIPRSGTAVSRERAGRAAAGGCRLPARWFPRRRPRASCTGSPASTPRPALRAGRRRRAGLVRRRPADPTAGAGVVTARRDPGGMVELPPAAFIPIPAALRRRCGLVPGDQVMLAAIPDQDTLTAYCLAVVDQALRAHGSFPHAQAQGVQR